MNNITLENEFIKEIELKEKPLQTRFKQYGKELNLSDYDDFMENELGILHNIHKIFSNEPSENEQSAKAESELDTDQKFSMPEMKDAFCKGEDIKVNFQPYKKSDYASQLKTERKELPFIRNGQKKDRKNDIICLKL